MLNLDAAIDGAPNFRIKEIVHSSTALAYGVDNTPTMQELNNAMYLARNVLQPIRDHFGKPIRVNSWYRNAQVNKLVGGSPTSFHRFGMAADIEFLHVNDGELIDIFEFVYNELPFTELVAEELPNGWIHVALAKGREDEKQTKYKLYQGPVRRASFDEIMQILRGDK